ncbi:hypothetical protein KMZ29_16305 [Bradyrhizobium sediminis]|uniref:Uncharacterized protein n=1 Tax=Bradyrhizobium sediminis TaxID=2840469 RepID=A0A975RPI3_9BRAD|nr:hypothetical protein KMZ29_16305 [Bradyrhizobium sediminis]
MAVVGNGNIDVGNETSTRKPGEPRIEAPNSVRMKRPGNCGAMSQQCGDSGNYSTPQKFVQLVGCREPKARPEPWVRPGPAKR